MTNPLPRVGAYIDPSTPPEAYAHILHNYARLHCTSPLPAEFEITDITCETRQLNHYYEPRPGDLTSLTRISGVVRPVSR